MTTPTRHRTRPGAWRPTSRAGRWSAGLASVAIGATVVLVAGFQLGVLQSAENFTDDWLLTAAGLAQLACAAAALATGVVARTRGRDRSPAVLAASLLGLLIALLVLQQVGEGLGWLEG